MEEDKVGDIRQFYFPASRVYDIVYSCCPYTAIIKTIVNIIVELGDYYPYAEATLEMHAGCTACILSYTACVRSSTHCMPASTPG